MHKPNTKTNTQQFFQFIPAGIASMQTTGNTLVCNFKCFCRRLSFGMYRLFCGKTNFCNR